MTMHIACIYACYLPVICMIMHMTRLSQLRLLRQSLGFIYHRICNLMSIMHAARFFASTVCYFRFFFDQFDMGRLRLSDA